VTDDVPGLILLRISREQQKSAPIEELKDATSEAIALLVNEAQHGLVRPEVVIKQLEERNMILYIFFYLSSLWKGDGIETHAGENIQRLMDESRALVDGVADLAVRLFASYDRELLMDFLTKSTFYTFEKVSTTSLFLMSKTDLITGYARMRGARLHPGIGLLVLQNWSNETRPLPHYRSPCRRFPSHLLR
jgi:hypothetical protein